MARRPTFSNNYDQDLDYDCVLNARRAFNEKYLCTF